MENSLIEILKVIVFSSVLFVWVVRYQNIIEEFKKFGYPTWIRDFVGILKISFAILILSKEQFLVQVGSVGLIFLMVVALITHLKIRNKISLMVPSFALLCSSILILLFNMQQY